MTFRTPTDVKPDLYAPIESIETPALVVDLSVMGANLREYTDIARRHDVRLRSHAKTHKVPDIARMQHRASNGGGVVCQTLSEAETMAHGGVDDIYLSYMVVGDSKLDRLVHLSERLDRFETTVDCPGNVEPLQRAAEQHGTTVEVVLELDVGLERVGVASDEMVEFAEFVAGQSNLRVAGLMAFEGHVFGDPDVQTAEEYEERCLDLMDGVADVVDRVKAAGVAVPEVKVGSTATSRYSAAHPVVTEINPGMYTFNDVNLVRGSPDVALEDCALTVLTTVISTPTDDRVVVDAGSKSISLETDGDPLPADGGDLDYYNASEEHGWVNASGVDLSVGDRVAFVPPHVCPTVNLHDTLVGVREGHVKEVWDVAARGKVK
jgi:D-serine deaminase-like pyridoxal phosphate-dependent protein